uniref:ATP synthase subunit 8 n=1 Tax=Zizania latifolia TaxID=58934 RepID=UPI0030025CAC|nr:ATP synthase subunit 8 [Zizania latifolia]
MPQLDKFTYLSQFFWLCLLLFTFYIRLLNNNNGILGISRILKLRNQLLSHRGNKIRSKDPKNLEDISRKGFSTGLSYMYSSLSEVSQWCKTVDYLGKRGKIALISDFGPSICAGIIERKSVHEEDLEDPQLTYLLSFITYHLYLRKRKTGNDNPLYSRLYSITLYECTSRPSYIYFVIRSRKLGLWNGQESLR